MTTTRLAFVGLVLLVLHGAAGAAATPAQKCRAAKNGEAGKYAFCREKAEARFALTGDAPSRALAFQKCLARYDAKWPGIEAKAAGACPSTGDQALIQGALDDTTTNVATALAGGGLDDCPGDLATCTAALAACQTSLGSCQAQPTGQPLKTSQTSCWDTDGNPIACAGTGHDGELQKGVVRGWVDNGDGTITDTTTGLMWEKLADDNGQHDQDDVYDWTSAVTVKIADLNANGGFAGHTDWRLPNAFELATLLNMAAAQPAVQSPFNVACELGCNVETCSCTASAHYWTSSTFLRFKDDAFFWDFYNGLSGAEPKGSESRVRAVRGG